MTLRLPAWMLPALALALWLASPSLAQGPPRDSPDMTIDARQRAEVLDALVSALDRNYVFPQAAAKMGADLRRRREAGEYDAITGARAFASTLTDHLRAITRDKHLGVNYSYDTLPPERKESGPSPEDSARLKAFAEKYNCGFEKVERMEGNVGYLDLRGFMPVDVAGETASAAMTFVANTDALIIDLRYNGGGEPAMVAFLTSYLFDGEPVHLNDLYFRPEDRTQQWWTLAYVPGKRFGKLKPVYVLTSARTFSAAEEFAYNLKNLKRATIVGETTGGGAHPGEFRRLSDHFGAFVPNGRAINPISGKNWEGTGVEPDIVVPADLALKAAQLAAAETLVKAEDDPGRAEAYRRTIERLKKEIDDARKAPARGDKPRTK